ncbi:hypothetical protein [Pelovirga terrestris]|uniref:Uncharacterized protein n=1 Tax=Pelovirga terrestris TaxID=2771352 RepID=A0A8J6UR86_9BACT|nr:hypothetical protein [Pelovirga terrestris]MBD1400846.1 hypothetical protein [Pelovirga terrestris]
MITAETPKSNNPSASRDLLLIDGSAPFFVPFVDGQRKNWSKAPLDALINQGKISQHHRDLICAALVSYCDKARALGFTAITFDDLAHLVILDSYSALLKETVHSWRSLMQRAFAIAAAAGLRIFINTDLMFWNQYIEAAAGSRSGRDGRVRQIFVHCLEQLFTTFAEVSGIVTRIGEADGHDVDSPFKSRLWITSARQCNRWLQESLPVCEAHNTLLIFRTWSLGAFPIGDISWNETTEKAAFADIRSDAFVVSRKYGAADFFRYLPLNERITESRHAQIIELQARREYEGFGVFPAYVGRQYEEYREQLSTCPTLRGILVWCQTGGWSHFDRLTFLDNSSPWNELNTIAAIELFTTNRAAASIMRQFCREQFSEQDAEIMIEIVEIFDRLVDRLWYFAPFARRQIWFRRLRVPPLLWIFWDTILVNQPLRLMFRAYLDSPAEIRNDDREERELIRRLRLLIKQLSVEQADLTLGGDSLRLLYSLRRFYLGNAGKKRIIKISARIERYRNKHPQGFIVESDYSPFRIRWITAGALFALLMRSESDYRIIDRALLIRLTGLVFPLLRRFQHQRIPELAERQAGGLDLFFR